MTGRPAFAVAKVVAASSAAEFGRFMPTNVTLRIKPAAVGQPLPREAFKRGSAPIAMCHPGRATRSQREAGRGIDHPWWLRPDHR